MGHTLDLYTTEVLLFNAIDRLIIKIQNKLV